MADLAAFAGLVPLDHGLVVVSTARPDGTIQSSVVNAGVLDHPLTGQPVVGLVSAGSSKRLANLRERPRATVVIRAGWRWSGVEGPVDLAGPDDALGDIDVNPQADCIYVVNKTAGSLVTAGGDLRPTA